MQFAHTRCHSIVIFRVGLGSFATISLCIASQWTFVLCVLSVLRDFLIGDLNVQPICIKLCSKLCEDLVGNTWNAQNNFRLRYDGENTDFLSVVVVVVPQSVVWTLRLKWEFRLSHHRSHRRMCSSKASVRTDKVPFRGWLAGRPFRGTCQKILRKNWNEIVTTNASFPGCPRTITKRPTHGTKNQFQRCFQHRQKRWARCFSSEEKQGPITTVNVYFVIDSVRELVDTPYCFIVASFFTTNHILDLEGCVWSLFPAAMDLAVTFQDNAYVCICWCRPTCEKVPWAEKRPVVWFLPVDVLAGNG